MRNLLRLFMVAGLVAFAFVVIAFGLVRHDANLLAPVRLLLFAVGLAFYFLPTVLAFYRDCKATAWIAAVNVLLGWTVIGWVVAIGWAAGGKTRPLPPTISAPPVQPLPGH